MTRNEAFRVLGVTPTTDKKKIKEAYRALVKKYHPDKNPDDEDAAKRMAEINAAKDVIDNPQKQQGGAGFYYNNKRYDSFDDLEPQFADFMKKQYRGETYGVVVQVPIEKLFTGCDYEIKVNGENISFEIPAGTSERNHILLKGKGGLPGMPGADHGDIRVKVSATPHPIFNVNYNDVVVRVVVDLVTITCGGTVQVPTLSGFVNMKVKPGTKNGAQLKLRGRGLPVLNTKTFGDQFCVIWVEIPDASGSSSIDIKNFKKFNDALKYKQIDIQKHVWGEFKEVV